MTPQVSGQPTQPPPRQSHESWTTIRLLASTTRWLEERGAESPRLAAERLLAHVLACKRVDLYLESERRVGEPELAPYRQLVRAHAAGTPLQYLVGETEFMGLRFRTDKRALIPRPETEILVDALVKLWQSTSRPQRVLELGVGSGAIAVSLAALLPRVEVWSTESRADSAALARENARRHDVESRVHILVMDRFAALSADLEEGFDAVVSNPPYVSTDELETLPSVVRDHEPWVALHGGADGLDFHRTLCSQGLFFLAPGGTLVVEIGATQGDRVRELFGNAGLHGVRILRDYAGHDRIVLGIRP
jgi:release factor glutamine methyltransferase